MFVGDVATQLFVPGKDILVGVVQNVGMMKAQQLGRCLTK